MPVSPVVTFEDVKLFLNDFPEANRLTKKSQFSPERIRKAVIYTIESWNETPPLIRKYDEFTFPYKTTLLFGTVSWLFMGESTHQERNHLTYQSGGLTVDDDDSASAYHNFANYFGNLFKEKMDVQKKAENIESGWGTLGSDYSGNWHHR